MSYHPSRVGFMYNMFVLTIDRREAQIELSLGDARRLFKRSVESVIGRVEREGGLTMTERVCLRRIQASRFSAKEPCATSDHDRISLANRVEACQVLSCKSAEATARRHL